MAELERALVALGRGLEYPPEPPIAATVRERIEADEAARATPPRAPAPRPRSLRILVIAALVLAALGATALAASPAARDALRDLLDIGGVEIETTQAPPPEPARRGPDLGRRSTLRAAPAELGFRPLVPGALGRPDATFADLAVPALALVYRPGPRLPRTTTTGVGLLVTELPGRISGQYLHKVVPQATTVERLRVEGRRAAWIAGAPHFFFYGRRGRGIGERDLDVAQNVLLLDHGPLLVRLEGAFGKREAVRIASSLEPR
jgi:hypothetical protein